MNLTVNEIDINMMRLTLTRFKGVLGDLETRKESHMMWVEKFIDREAGLFGVAREAFREKWPNRWTEDDEQALMDARTVVETLAKYEKPGVPGVSVFQATR